MKKALVPLAPGCEELEAVTIIDVLRRGGVEVVSASLDKAPVKASRGVILIADALLDEVMAVDDVDMVAIPGGMGGSKALTAHEPFIAFLKRMHDTGRYVGAICAGPMALGKAGLLDGRVFTAYPDVLNAADYPGAVYTGNAVEIDGRILTSRGPGTALDFALIALEVLEGRQCRDKVEQALVRC